MKRINLFILGFLMVFLSSCGTNQITEVDGLASDLSSTVSRTAHNEIVTPAFMKAVEKEAVSTTTNLNSNNDSEKPSNDNNRNKHIQNKKEQKKIETIKHNESFIVQTDANVRDYPSLNSSRVNVVLAKGTEVVAFEKAIMNGTTWYHVKYDNQTGWMSSVVLTDKKTYEEAQKKVIEEPAKKKQEANSVQSPQKSPESQYSANTIYFNGKAVPYKNGGKSNGQAIIDSHGGYKYASTWGGASSFSGNDGLNTHFIGHNPGVFTGILNASTFIITDSTGTPFTYKVTKRYKVDDYAKGIKDGVNYWDRITGTGGGERVTMQTCENSDVNWIIEATLQ